MNTSLITQEIEGFLSKTFYVNPFILNSQSRLQEDLKLNHIEFLEVIYVLEQRYGIEINDADLIKCKRVLDLSLMFSKTGEAF
ncbi:Acyl carrier protein [Pseudarcicella hirudinis]|uniref:Acyl carrier protein n=1 Tax=Pseudarcicella hirudinis TaxID=1079859 RepID=A0A1I5TNV2_9BACT|nr:acyl carrier protein [Pseudarcicella hirudinis]SFP84762.1 Acyl carrier protein [Pseudarcicella hirudinis]